MPLIKGATQEVKGAILAAGLGKRLFPLIRQRPKPLLPLGGKVPMAELWVRKLVEFGITRLSMNLCVHKEQLRAYFGNGTNFGAKISYVEEDKPTGTLGGISKQALGRSARQVFPGESRPTIREFKGSTLIVPAGDIVTEFGSAELEEMYDLHRKAGAAFTAILTPVPWERRKDFGTALLAGPKARKGLFSQSGRIKMFVEKDPNSPSNLNNASIYMIEMELLRAVEAWRTEASLTIDHPFYSLKHLFPAMLGELPGRSLPRDFVLWGIQYDGAWFDVGQKRDYLRVNEAVLDGTISVGLPYAKQPAGYLGSNVDIDFSKVKIRPPVIIGNNCVIEAGAIIGPYATIGDNWVIGKGVQIEHAVLLEPSSPTASLIEKGISIHESILVGGTINFNVQEKIVDVAGDGKLETFPIDYIPPGPRV